MIDILSGINAEWNDGKADAAGNETDDCKDSPREHPTAIFQDSLDLLPSAVSDGDRVVFEDLVCHYSRLCDHHCGGCSLVGGGKEKLESKAKWGGGNKGGGGWESEKVGESGRDERKGETRAKDRGGLEERGGNGRGNK